MTDVVAALGLIQYERYPQMLQTRKEYIARLDEAIDNLNVDLDDNHKVAHLTHFTDEYTSSGHLYLVRLQGRTREQANAVIEQMAERGIATNVHYKPLPMILPFDLAQDKLAYKKLGYDIKDFPNAFKMFENVISLPPNTRMTMEDVEYVIENLIDILKNA